ncbi:MAG: hypothetical protein ABJC13_01875 [Acidobacteriota bacterium]
MRNVTLPSLSALALGAAFLAPPATAAPLARAHNDSFSVTNVRVFEGVRTIPHATVVVRNGEIAAVGQNVHAPHDLPEIDGTGSTLLPGLIDSHGHSRDRQKLVRSAEFGVTTLMDMWSLPHYVARMKREHVLSGVDVEPGVRARALRSGEYEPTLPPEGCRVGFATPILASRPG